MLDWQVSFQVPVENESSFSRWLLQHPLWEKFHSFLWVQFGKADLIQPTS